MKSVWRVVDARFADDPLSTEGSYRFPARWHKAGMRVLYCAQTESLARAERFVHLLQETDLAFVLFEFALPTGARIEKVEDLPVDLAGWDDAASGVARAAGAWWIEHTKALGLSVPSVLSTSERDVLLRAASPDFRKIRVARRTRFRFDPRLFKAPMPKPSGRGPPQKRSG